MVIKDDAQDEVEANELAEDTLLEVEDSDPEREVRPPDGCLGKIYVVRQRWGTSNKTTVTYTCDPSDCSFMKSWTQFNGILPLTCGLLIASTVSDRDGLSLS